MAPEKKLCKNLDELKEFINSKCGIGDSDFMKEYDISVFKHNQYPPKGHNFKKVEAKKQEKEALKKDKVDLEMQALLTTNLLEMDEEDKKKIDSSATMESDVDEDDMKEKKPQTKCKRDSCQFQRHS
jgi:hypothetical protein